MGQRFIIPTVTFFSILLKVNYRLIICTVFCSSNTSYLCCFWMAIYCLKSYVLNSISHQIQFMSKILFQTCLNSKSIVIIIPMWLKIKIKRVANWPFSFQLEMKWKKGPCSNMYKVLLFFFQNSPPSIPNYLQWKESLSLHLHLSLSHNSRSNDSR